MVINSKEIALRGDEWRKRVYFHHTTYHGGATWTLAWELHKKDPTLVIKDVATIKYKIMQIKFCLSLNHI